MFKPSDKWSDYMTSKKILNAVQVKELLVDNMETNNTDPHASHLRGGANQFKVWKAISSARGIEFQEILQGDRSSTKRTASVKKTLRAVKAHHRHLIQRHHHTQWKLRNRREKRGSRVKARHLNSHLFEIRNPPWISILKIEQICPCSLHQLL